MSPANLLGTVFRELLSGRVAATDELETELRLAVDECRERWPTVLLDDRAFLSALAGKVAQSAAPADAWQGLFLSDLYLATAAGAGSAAALDVIERTHFPTLRRTLSSFDSSPSFMDDVRQAIRERLFTTANGLPPAVLTYAGDAPLGDWLRVVALREAIRLRRATTVVLGDDRLLDLQAPNADPELALLKATYRAEFQAAFDSALRALPPRERTLLRLVAIDRLSGVELARTYQVSGPTMSRWLAAARSRLTEDTRRTLSLRLNLNDSQLDSLARLVVSQLEVNLAASTDSSTPKIL